MRGDHTPVSVLLRDIGHHDSHRAWCSRRIRNGVLRHRTTYPVVTYLSAGLVNLVVPSGGGQWVIQGAIVLEGASQFEIIPRAILALAFGDAWTNMLQPFWAVPLAITGLRARDIIGYTGAILVVGGAVTILLLLLLPT